MLKKDRALSDSPFITLRDRFLRHFPEISPKTGPAPLYKRLIEIDHEIPGMQVHSEIKRIEQAVASAGRCRFNTRYLRHSFIWNSKLSFAFCQNANSRSHLQKMPNKLQVSRERTSEGYSQPLNNVNQLRRVWVGLPMKSFAMIGLLRVLGQNRMLMEELQLVMEDCSGSIIKMLKPSREQGLIISERNFLRSEMKAEMK